ncbi:hypothetical protein Tco_0554225 [Tanacetum coccineum]
MQFVDKDLSLGNARNRPIVATSQTEAESLNVALQNAVDKCWVQIIVGLCFSNFMNTKIHIDNESTICIVKNPVYHSKTKHIEIRHHFIRDCYEKKLINVEKIHTDLNVADLLTKPFDGPRFNYLVVSIECRVAEIVLSSSSNLRYAVNYLNPTIYDSLVKQFWQSAIASTKEDGFFEISATIDNIRYTITEASIRESLKLDDATGITMLPNDDLFQGMGQIGYPTDGTFTFWKSFFTPQWRYLVHHLLHCISSKSMMGINLVAISPALTVYPLIFGNMKRGFQGAPRPLLPSMLLVATNPIAGQEHAAQAQSQPLPPPPPIPSPTPTPIPTPTSPPPPPIPTPTSPTPPPIPTPTSPPPPPPPETEPPTDEHTIRSNLLSTITYHHHSTGSQVTLLYR